MGLHENKKFLYNKGSNWQSEQTVYKMKENHYQLPFRQGSNIQNLQSISEIKYKEIKFPINKWANELNRHLFIKET